MAPAEPEAARLENKTGTYYGALVAGRLQVSRLRRDSDCNLPLCTPLNSITCHIREKKEGRMTVQGRGWGREGAGEFALVAVAYGFRCSSV